MGIFGSGNANQTPKLHQLKVTQSVNGIVIPIGWGCVRVPMNLLWYGDFTSTKSSVGGKGLGGKSSTQYDYHSAILGLLGQGPITAIKNVYSQSGALSLQSASTPITLSSSDVANGVSSGNFSTDSGVSMSVTISGTANDYGSGGSTSYSVTSEMPMSLAASKNILNSGEYYVDSNGTYWFSAADIGKTVTINYSFSLYVLSSTEDYNVPDTSPFEIAVQYQSNFYKDVSVYNILTGKPLTSILSGTPSAGQYRANGGNYIFSSSDAGLAVAITYSWRQSDSNINPSSKLGFTLIEGIPGQNPWSYLESKHLSQALGYSTLALIAVPNMDLGTSATMPDYNFECQFPLAFGGGIVDADVALVIQDFLKNPYYGAQFDGDIDDSLMDGARSYWASNNFFASPLLDSAQSAADQIGNLCEAGNVGVFWSEGKIKFVPYGDITTIGNGYVYTPETAPIVDLNDDDFIHSDNEDPVTISRKPWQDAYNDVKVQFENRLNNYNPDIVEEHDDYAIARYGLRAEGQKDYSFLKTQAAATFAANIRLQRNVYIRNQYKFKISGLRYSMLEPMDLVTLTDANLGLNLTPVRITEIEESEDRELDITAEEFPWGTATATIYMKQPTNPAAPPPALADPGNTGVILIFEPTERVATTLANATYQIWLALTGGINWGGCHVWLSTDGSTYQRLPDPQIGTARGGELISNLPKGIDPDETDVAQIVINGQLTTVSETQADNFSTLSKLGDEYFSYANASLMGSNWQTSHAYSVNDLVYDGANLQQCTTAGTSGSTRPDWNGTLNGVTSDGAATWKNIGGVAATSGQASSGYELTYLRRGVFSSPNVEHFSGETFVRLDEKVYIYSYDPSLIGKTVYFKFTSFNLLQLEEQDLSAVKAYPYRIGGISAATNMTIDSILDISGDGLATIRIYAAGGSPGTPGTMATKNGAIISLSAYSQAGFQDDTLYYVNVDSSGNYHFYTDRNQFLAEQATLGYLQVGSVMTVGIYAFIPTAAGGRVAIGASFADHGATVQIPQGFSLASSMGWAGTRSSWQSSNHTAGVLACNVSSSGVITDEWNDNSGHTWTGPANWVEILWNATDVAVLPVNGGQFIVFTTPAGTKLAVGVGTLQDGASFDLPAGFNTNDMISCASMATHDTTSNPLCGIYQCAVNGTTVTGLYTDAAGSSVDNSHHWTGKVNWTAICWDASSNGVSSTAVTDGNFVIIDIENGSQVAFGCGVSENGDSFGIPEGFSAGQVSAACSMAGTDKATDAHGITNCSITGTTFTGTYMDGGSHTWHGPGNWIAICWK